MFSTQLVNVSTDVAQSLTANLSMLNAQASVAVNYLAQQQRGGPLGPEFGKASPVGLFVIVLLFFSVMFIGWSVNRHLRRMNRRRIYAEKHGLDVFDVAQLNEKMTADGEFDRPRRKRRRDDEDQAD